MTKKTLLWTFLLYVIIYLSKDDMYFSSFFIAKITSIILPYMAPLHIGWEIDDLQKTRKMLESSFNKTYSNTNIVNIFLKNQDHRHQQELYLNKQERIMYRLYIPKYANKNLNVVLWFHGGGFIIGNVRYDDDMCNELSYKSNSIIVNVNYGLSPENKFPIALQDSIEAVKWVYKNIYKYNGSNNNIFLAGESAGGNLVISIIPELKNYIRRNIRGVISIYPPLNGFSYTTSYWKYANFNGFLLLNHMSRIYLSYLSNVNELNDERVVPLLMKNKKIKMFPSTLFILAKYDILYDDGIEFSKKMIENNINVTATTYPEIHGFFYKFGYGSIAFNEMIDYVNYHGNKQIKKVTYDYRDYCDEPLCLNIK